MAAADDAPVQLRRQLTLDVGGAAVNTSKIGSLTFAAQMKDLEQQLVKGSDVELQITCRVTGVDVFDKYDAHGNVSETVRAHDLRIDDLEITGITAVGYRLASDEPGPDDPPAGDGQGGDDFGE